MTSTAMLICAACGPVAAHDLRRDAIVYGEDDRLEFYEIPEAAQRDLVRGSAVALLPREVAELVATGRTSEVMTWGEAAGLCAEEPFANQPAAGFCSGVLVGPALVLTSEHCISMAPLHDWVVTFDYYLVTEETLQVDSDDVFDVERVVAVGVRDDTAEEQLDFALVELSGQAGPRRSPAAVYTSPPQPSVGQRLYSISAPGGVPLKWDAGGSVVGIREQDDYFIADTDTSQGSSGSGVFDDRFGLLGVLSRGGSDVQPTAEGCNTTVRSTEGNERFTLAHRAIEELCEVEPMQPLCDEACSQPCRNRVDDVPPAPGCTLAVGTPTRCSSWLINLLIPTAIMLHRNRRRRSGA
ncbi:MAG TPA: serine protease [Polyangiaceae bacterium]|nr:serine protease [Polyangiaceae bacterium]